MASRYCAQGRSGNEGFTLVEILVVVFIVAVAGLAMLTSISFFGSTYQVETAATELASTIRQARLLAIRNRVRHGVFMDVTNQRYTLYQENSATPNMVYDDGVDVVVAIKSFPAGVGFGGKSTTSSLSGGTIGTNYVTLNDDTISYNPRGTGSSLNVNYVYLVSLEAMQKYPGDDPPLAGLGVYRSGAVHVFKFNLNNGSWDL